MKRIFQNVCVAVIVTALGSAAMAVNIKTVSVGNVGNTVDSTGYGAVGAPYGIGKYEVTAGQYTEFLNAVADTDTYGLYSSDMNSDSYGCQITRHGSSGNYTYDFSGRPSGIEADWVNRPVNYVSSGDAMRFANWLHNGQPTGAQGLATTEDGAYYLNGATSSSALLAVSRKSDWKWAITSEDEWYKAAYHKNDGVTGNYFNYPTGSDNAPSNALNGNGNNATFHDSGHTIGSPYYRTEVGAHVNSASPYGTFDQGGNLWEWNEATISGSYRGLRGGSFYVYGGNGLHASNREIGIPAGESSNIGFRVARAFDAPPQQPQRPDPTPPPAPSKSNLVLYTHGWNTSEFEFTNPNGSWGQLDTALRTAVGGSDWEVQGYGWTQDSGSPFTGPGYALAYAAVHGTSVGDQIGGNPNADYDNVHIIAHSAGSAFAAAAATRIQALSPDTNVHITLLDPYIGIGGGWFGGFWFGTGDWVDGLTDADWADNYFTRDSTGVLTELPLTHAHNVDVTRLDPNFDPVFLSSHGWPVEWYTETVNGTPRPGSNGYGFPLSVEGGGWNPSAYPVGNDPAVLGGGSSEPTDIVVRHDTVLNVLDQLRANSGTGTVNVAGTGFSMLTGSPVWMTTLVETDDIVNFLTFEADFTSDPGAEGLLAVFWENELLGLIDERYVLDGMQEYTMFLPGNFESGAYALSFRLDPYTDIDSSVLIDNVATGFVTPEPATLTLLALGGLVVLRRRRKQ